MAYGTLNMAVLAVVLFTSLFVQTATALLNTVVVGGGGTTVTVSKLVKDNIYLENKGPALSYIPHRPSHFFQPRREEVMQVFDKFYRLEKSNPDNVTKTVYITGGPGAGKTQLAGQFGREFLMRNEQKNKNLFVGTMIVDSCLHIVEKHFQIAHDLGCVNYTEVAIPLQLSELLNETTLFINCVKEELRKRPGWLLIIDGLTLHVDDCVKKLSHLWPHPNEHKWGNGYVLVTTRDQAPIGPSIDVMDLGSGMSEEDAVNLLTNVSGHSDKQGAVELVKSLNRHPLSVARCVMFQDCPIS